VHVWINGEQRELEAGASVLDALTALGAPSSGVAVAVDGEVVPRAGWSGTGLVDGARIEVLTAVQGG
jgi:sulfur carrier protein